MYFRPGLCFIFKKFLLFHAALLKCFIYSRVGILDPPWCNNSCHAYQELGQGDFYSFDQKKVPLFLIYSLPTHKKSNQKENHAYLNLLYSICYREDIYRLVKLLTSRSSHPEVFIVKGILRISSKFTGEHPCWSVISITLLCNFIEIILRHECSPVNLLHIFRTPFLKNTSGWLSLKFNILMVSWTPKVHSELCQIFKIEGFVLTFFANCSILDVCQGSEYVSAIICT